MSAFWDKLKNKGQGEGSSSGKEKRATENVVFSKKGGSKAKKSLKTRKSVAKKKYIIPGEKVGLVERVIVRPRVSEDVMNKQVLGKYVFEVSLSATKPEIKKAVEAMYGVVVDKVNVIKYKPRTRSFRGNKGKMKAYKKAVATLKKGDSIEIFKEMK